MVRQFEAYLKSKGIKAKPPKHAGNATTVKPPNQNGKTTIQRRKRSIEPNIAYTLSKPEVSSSLSELKCAISKNLHAQIQGFNYRTFYYVL